MWFGGSFKGGGRNRRCWRIVVAPRFPLLFSSTAPLWQLLAELADGICPDLTFSRHVRLLAPFRNFSRSWIGADI